MGVVSQYIKLMRLAKISYIEQVAQCSKHNRFSVNDIYVFFQQVFTVYQLYVKKYFGCLGGKHTQRFLNLNEIHELLLNIIMYII